MAKAIVITPTTGAPELAEAIRSVNNQSISVDHLIVCDGAEFKEQTKKVLNDFQDQTNIYECYLPFNTGGGGYYGHRIMAAFSHLVNYDYILFLDQDNWFDTNHVELLVSECEKYNFEWAYSLRKIVDKDGNFICEDNCESLGRWPVWVDKNSYLIDSSSYCFSQSFIRMVGHIWDFGWGGDRRFYTIVKDEINHKNYGCTSQHTLNYRLGGNEGSVQADFFIVGNEKTLEYFNNKLPWLEQLK